MTIFDDFIEFEYSEDWERLPVRTFTAVPVGEDSYIPIGQVDLGVSLTETYVVIVVQPVNGKVTWRYGGEVRQVWDFAAGAQISSQFAGAQSKPTQLFVNKPQVIDLSVHGTGNFRLKYDPPTWFKQVIVFSWKYIGEVSNFTRDTLFDIGNVVGAGTLNEPNNLVNLMLNIQTSLSNLVERVEVIEDILINTNPDTIEIENQIQQVNQNVTQSVSQVNQRIDDLASDLARVLSGESSPDILEQNNDENEEGDY